MKTKLLACVLGAALVGPLNSNAAILIPSGAKDSKTEEANRTLVLAFWKEFFNEMKPESWPKYLSKDFVNHDPYEPSGGQEFADYIKANNTRLNRKAGPEKDRLFVLADGDLVMVIYPGNNKEDLTDNVHGNIVRVKDGKITDWWIVGDSGRPAGTPKPYANNKKGTQPLAK
ncbi:MAG: hypothetical protein QM808_08235 [Steroidobacteraceae bacterium]